MEYIASVILTVLMTICFFLLVNGVADLFSFTGEGVNRSAVIFQAFGTLGILIVLIIEFVLERSEQGGAP